MRKTCVAWDASAFPDGDPRMGRRAADDSPPGGLAGDWQGKGAAGGARSPFMISLQAGGTGKVSLPVCANLARPCDACRENEPGRQTDEGVKPICPDLTSHFQMATRSCWGSPLTAVASADFTSVSACENASRLLKQWVRVKIMQWGVRRPPAPLNNMNVDVTAAVAGEGGDNGCVLFWIGRMHPQ